MLKRVQHDETGRMIETSGIPLQFPSLANPHCAQELGTAPHLLYRLGHAPCPPCHQRSCLPTR